MILRCRVHTPAGASGFACLVHKRGLGVKISVCTLGYCGPKDFDFKWEFLHLLPGCSLTGMAFYINATSPASDATSFVQMEAVGFGKASAYVTCHWSRR